MQLTVLADVYAKGRHEAALGLAALEAALLEQSLLDPSFHFWLIFT